MNTDKIADRIAKLLALAARAGTPEEAATAAAQAQALAERHGIDQARIDAANEARSGVSTEAPIIRRDVFTFAGRSCPTWIGTLSMAVTACNRCSVFQSHGVAGACLTAYGREADLQVVEALMRVIVAQIDRLCDEWVAECRSDRGGRSSRDSFRKGASATVNARLREAVKEAQALALGEASKESGGFALPAAGSGEAATPGPSTSLVHVTAAIATLEQVRQRSEAKMREENKLRSRSCPGASNAGAAAAGRKAGQRVHLGGHRAIG